MPEEPTLQRKPWTVGRAGKALLVFVGIMVLLWVGFYLVLDAIGAATHSGIGSCGAYGDAGGLIFVLLLMGFVAILPATLYLTRLALRRMDPQKPAG